MGSSQKSGVNVSLPGNPGSLEQLTSVPRVKRSVIGRRVPTHGQGSGGWNCSLIKFPVVTLRFSVLFF